VEEEHMQDHGQGLPYKKAAIPPQAELKLNPSFLAYLERFHLSLLEVAHISEVRLPTVWRITHSLPTSEGEYAFDRLERLQQHVSLVTKGITLTQDDITSLEAALVLFSTFLYLKIPPSEKRARTLDALWEMREHLAVMRWTDPPGLN
jgi:hypothetical protein